MDSLAEAKRLLEEKNATCVILSQGEHVFFDRGVRPLLSALEDGILKDALVCDKVIGKSAAMLLTLGGIAKLHAKVISTHARRYLDAHGVAYTFDTECPYIVNRAGDGMCPMEAAVLSTENDADGVAALREKLKQMR